MAQHHILKVAVFFHFPAKYLALYKEFIPTMRFAP